MARESTGHYCLRCFAPLVRGKSLCGACGFVSTPSQRRRYWNLAPSIRRTQAVLQIVTMLVLLPPASFIRGYGFASAFTWVALHYTWSTLTARAPYFRARWFWGAYFLIAALVFATGALDLPPIPWAAVAAVILAAVSVLVGIRFGRWQRRLIAAGAERVTDPAALLADRMASPRESGFEIHRHYCLRCFATIAHDTARCEACGYTSRGDDRERYWTVKPGLLLATRVLQTVTALALPVLWIAWAVLGGALGPMSRGRDVGPGIGIALGIATILSLPLYWTFGHLVRRKPELDMSSFWAVLFLATAAVLAGIHLPVAAAFAALAILVVLAGRAARRWKTTLVESGPAAA